MEIPPKSKVSKENLWKYHVHRQTQTALSESGVAPMAYEKITIVPLEISRTGM